MLDLESAIKHCEEVAEENEKSLRGWKECINRGTVGWSDFDKEKVDTSITRCSKCAEEHRQLAEWLKELKQLREQTKWIPVSERLPKDEDYVLVCYADGSIKTAYYYIDTNIYPLEFEDCCDTGWYDCNEDFIDQDVIAWMPLPKPYKPQESED